METKNRFKLARTDFNKNGPQSVKKVSDETGITRSLIDDLETDVGKLRGVSYLIVGKLADYYGVSADYLLGFTDIPNTDTTIQAVHKITGLSVGALCKLAEMNIDKRKAFCNIISLMIENQNAEHFLALIAGMISCSYNGTENEPIDISIDGIELHTTKGDYLTTTFQTRSMQDIPGIIEQYKNRFEMDPLQKSLMGGKENADNP